MSATDTSTGTLVISTSTRPITNPPVQIAGTLTFSSEPRPSSSVVIHTSGADFAVPGTVISSSVGSATLDHMPSSHSTLTISSNRSDGNHAAIRQRAYPHIMEAAAPAISLLETATKDARQALDAYNEADIEVVASSLTSIAALCAKAHQLTRFNEAFGAIVSYVRRATLFASPHEISRAALNALVQALAEIIANPTVSIAEAALLQSELSASGWQGELADARELLERIQALMREEESATRTVSAE